jgi:protein TonB
VTHPNSPVQPGGGFSWQVLLLAPIAAVAWWGWQNDWPIENGSSHSASTAAPAPAVPARANLSAVIGSDDYPDEAIRNDEQGKSGFVLSIDRRGRVTDCTITKSSGSRSLDRATCSIMSRRARFTPARNDTGQTVESTYHSSVSWVLADT